VQSKRVWARALGVDRKVVIEAVNYDDDAEEIVVRCRLRRGVKRRCGRCDRRSPLYDQGDGRRRWRSLDAGTIRVFIDAAANTEFVTRSTLKSKETREIGGVEHFVHKVDISSASHPFFTGTQSFVDTAGRVERFVKKYGKRFSGKR